MLFATPVADDPPDPIPTGMSPPVMLCSAPRRSVTIGLAVTIAIIASALQFGSVSPASATWRDRCCLGQSIQAAVDAAHPGDRIVVRAGTYAEQVTVAKHGIKLLGLRAVLVPPASSVTNTCSGLTGPDTEAGICVTGRGVNLAPFVLEHRKVISVRKRVRNVRVTGFTVRGFSGANVAPSAPRAVESPTTTSSTATCTVCSRPARSTPGSRTTSSTPAPRFGSSASAPMTAGPQSSPTTTSPVTTSACAFRRREPTSSATRSTTPASGCTLT